MLRIGANGEDGAGDFRMHGFDAAIEHFREAGDVGNIADGNAGFAEEAGGAAGGDEVGSEGVEGAGEFGHTCLVGDAEEDTHRGKKPDYQAGEGVGLSGVWKATIWGLESHFIGFEVAFNGFEVGSRWVNRGIRLLI